MLSSNACVSALIEKYSSTFSSPSNSSERTREGTPAFSTRSRVENHSRARKKKRGWTRRRGNERPRAVSVQPFSQSGVRSRRARGRLDGRGISREKGQAFSRCNEEFSWRKRQKRRDFYPVLRRFFCCCCSGVIFFKEKRGVFSRERT